MSQKPRPVDAIIRKNAVLTYLVLHTFVGGSMCEDLVRSFSASLHRQRSCRTRHYYTYHMSDLNATHVCGSVRVDV
jgi:hypothetical protein